MWLFCARSGRKDGLMRGMGQVYRRGGVWWVQHSFRGRKVRESRVQSPYHSNLPQHVSWGPDCTRSAGAG